MNCPVGLYFAWFSQTLVCLQVFARTFCAMEKQPRLTDDPRIMVPLEEFLRTVRDVLEGPNENGATGYLEDPGDIPEQQLPVKFWNWW